MSTKLIAARAKPRWLSMSGWSDPGFCEESEAFMHGVMGRTEPALGVVLAVGIPTFLQAEFSPPSRPSPFLGKEQESAGCLYCASTHAWNISTSHNQ
jgi:hypothetical protein